MDSTMASHTAARSLAHVMAHMGRQCEVGGRVLSQFGNCCFCCGAYPSAGPTHQPALFECAVGRVPGPLFPPGNRLATFDSAALTTTPNHRGAEIRISNLDVLVVVYT